MSSRQGYEVVLYHGAAQPMLEGVSAVINLDASGPEQVIDCLRASGLTPADLRSKTLFLVDEFSDHRVALALYAALVGFAGRRLDFSTGAGTTIAGSLHHAGLTAEDTGRPEHPVELVTVGPALADEPTIDPGRPLDPGTVTTIRYARKVQLHPTAPGNQPLLTQFIVMSALRVRNGAEHFPALVGANGAVVELDLLRREGSELRRSIHTDVRDALVPALPVTKRQEALVHAASIEMELVLVKLGSEQNVETGYWRCTRPGRHRNGDANPSMKVDEGRVRCFRCDTEPVDSLRLVIDTLDLAPDAALAFLAG
jgi:hypothetical protein